MRIYTNSDSRYSKRLSERRARSWIDDDEGLTTEEYLDHLKGPSDDELEDAEDFDDIDGDFDGSNSYFDGYDDDDDEDFYDDDYHDEELADLDDDDDYRFLKGTADDNDDTW